MTAPRDPVDSPSAPEPGKSGPHVRSTFWYGFWLAVVLMACKWLAWRPLNYLRWASKHPFSDASIVTNDDLLFALFASLTFQLLLLLARRRPRLGRVVWGCWLLFCVVSVLYAIVSIPVFIELRAPLTYSLVSLSRNVKSMSASLTPALSWKLGLAVVVAPPVYLLVAALSDRFLQPRRTVLVRSLQAAALVLILVRAAVIQRGYLPEWKWEPDRRFAESPHWSFITSCFTELTGSTSPHLPNDFPKEYVDDFRPVPATPPTAALAVPPGQRPKNVIVLVLESVGTRYLGVYGSPYDTTPNLRRELDHALVFDRAYSHDGMTTCSLLPIINSCYPQVSWWPDTERYPDIGGTSMPQALRARGYRSAFVTSGDLNWAGEDQFLSHRGFDRIIDAADLRERGPNFSWGVQDRHMFDAMLEWIDHGNDPTKPFFMVGWTLATHHPYFLDDGKEPLDFFKDRPAPPGSHPNLNRYLNTLRQTDERVGRLFTALRERGLADDTIVIITGDHGECFGEPHATLAHGWHVWDENCHVPLILWNPRLFPAARRSETIGGHIDLNPTIFDLLGLPTPAGVWQGRSLFAKHRPPRAYFFAALGDYQIGLRDENWKIIYNATLGASQLFDLATDPSEMHDVAASHPDLCRTLRQHLGAWLNFQDAYLARLRVHEVP